MTQVFEGVNAQLLNDVSVVDVKAEECSDNTLVEILVLQFYC